MIRACIIILVVIFITGCSKEDENKVRIFNSLSRPVSHVRMDGVNFEDLSSFSSSAYQVLEGGNYTLWFVLDGTSIKSEPITIEDDGIRKWKVTIITENKISLEEDSY